MTHSPSTSRPHPQPLPPTPFRTVDALRVGITPARLRARHLYAPVHGVRMLASEAKDLAALCAGIGLVLPDGAAFSHTTAAALWGLPLPHRFDPIVSVHVTGRPGRRPLDTPLITAHAGLPGHDVVTHQGVPVTSLVRTWLDLGALTAPGGLAPSPLARPGATRSASGRSVGRSATARRLTAPRLPLTHTDLVAVTDALLNRRWPTTTRTDLETGLARWAGRRGAKRLRAALRDARHLVDSPMETRARLQLVASGFPCPLVGADVYDDQGRWVARPDLSWPQLRIAIEYDGGHHLNDPHQMRNDVARREEMERLGWRVLVLYADDVLGRWPATEGRVVQAFHDRGVVDLRSIAAASDSPDRARIVCPRP